jgi:hypothetical protein
MLTALMSGDAMVPTPRSRLPLLLSLSLPTAEADAHFNPENISRRAEAMPEEKTEKLPHG